MVRLQSSAIRVCHRASRPALDWLSNLRDAQSVGGDAGWCE
jgi:hypothetical protein